MIQIEQHQQVLDYFVGEEQVDQDLRATCFESSLDHHAYQQKVVERDLVLTVRTEELEFH